MVSPSQSHSLRSAEIYPHGQDSCGSPWTCLHWSGGHMCIGHPRSPERWVGNSSGNREANNHGGASCMQAQHGHLCGWWISCLAKGRSENINSTTFQLALSSVMAVIKCPKSKSRERINANAPLSSDNFQLGGFWCSFSIK